MIPSNSPRRRRSMAAIVVAVAAAQPTASAAAACTPGQLMNSCGNVSPSQGFLQNSGVFSPIETPGASATLPSGINDRGQIVGIGLRGESNDVFFSGTACSAGPGSRFVVLWHGQTGSRAATEISLPAGQTCSGDGQAK
jgi:hypothetical protein